jgi:phage head maturation protease
MDRLIRKVAESSEEAPLKFVLSTDDLDLVGDIIIQEGGISLARSPLPAQIDHGGSMHDLVGTWKNVNIGKHTTVAELELMPKGTSPAVDLIYAVKAAGIRMATSVGFVPTDYELIWDKDGEWVTGFKFLKSVLTEASIVVTPANPQALQVAKFLKVAIPKFSPRTIQTDWHRRALALAYARRSLGQPSKH